MSENIKKIQGSDTHKGKRPRFGHDEGREASGKSEKEKLAASIGLLDSKLKEALAEEEYEQAARVPGSDPGAKREVEGK